jgi:hypothetical protein
MHEDAKPAGAHCAQCDTSAVHSVGSLYANTNLPVGTTHSQHLPTWLRSCTPPQKMTTWTGFTLALFLWPPCLFLLLTVAYSRWIGVSPIPHGEWIYVWAAAVGVAAWIIPAWKRRRLAATHNGAWEQKMEEWRHATLCLHCGNIASSS